MNLTVQEGQVKYLIDLKTKEAMHLYYGLKGKFEYTVEDRPGIMASIQNALETFAVNYDYVVYPESSSSFLGDVVTSLSIPAVKIMKNDLSKVIAFSKTLPLQKKEREAHEERFSQMGSSLKINLMKSTQRVKYESVLFQDTLLPSGKGLIIDDSYFSGTTFRALQAVAPECDFLAIFAK